VGLFYLIYSLNKIYFLDDFESKELSIGVEFITEENDIFQLFYRDSVTKLNEKMSQKIPIVKSHKSQWIRFSIPDTIELSHIRFDFGNTHKLSPVEIEKFLLRYNGNEIDLAKDSLSNHFKPNKYTVEINKNIFGRIKLGKRSDPFLLSYDLRPLVKKLKKEKNYTRIFLNLGITSFLTVAILFGFLRYSNPAQLAPSGNHFFVVCFLLMIVLPTMDNLFSLDYTKLKEKRELILKPDLNYNNIDNYPSSFETYYNDHFGFRDLLISTGGLLKAKFFHTSPSEEKVIIGKDNWVFYWKPDIQSSYKNENPFTTKGIEEFSQMLISTQAWANENNKIFYASIYPNKHSIYENKLPSRIRNLKKDTIDRTDVAYKILQENSILNINYVKDFIDNKDKKQLYYKHDTHWNAQGAMIAYKAIINGLRSKDTSIKRPLESKDFEIVVEPDFSHGDLLDFMGVDNSGKWFTEKVEKLKYKQKQELVVKQNFFGKRTTFIHNKTVDENKTVLLVGDSYSNELLKLLPLQFKKIYFSRNIRLSQQVIEKINPDIIIYGIVERNLENF
tara:strand:- start:15075 stop:16751 length:1677 start_codon:yes stop_codon:yes gene_type:complete